MKERRVALADVVVLNPRMPKILTENQEQSVAFVPMASVSERGILTEFVERPLREVIKGFTYFESGDVLLAKITPCMENGKACLVPVLPNKVGFGSTEFHVLRATEAIDRRYLFHCVWNADFRKTAAKNMTGSAGQKRVPAHFLSTYKIPLPPLPVQKRIAAILDKADAIRRKREKAIELTDSFLRSVFLEMFWANPDRQSWREVLVQDLVQDKKGSMRTGPFGSALRHDEFTTSGVAVLGIDNAVSNRFRWRERRFISLEKYEALKRYIIHPEDVIITIMGTTGRSAVVPFDIPLAISTKHLATLTLNRQIAEPHFIAFMIHSHPSILNQIRNANRGAIMDGLNLGIIKNLSIELPPLDLQKKFSTILEKSLSYRDKQELQFLNRGLASLNQSLQSMLFKGTQEFPRRTSILEVANAL
jgi:type I restriction enzyme, S subunit